MAKTKKKAATERQGHPCTYGRPMVQLPVAIEPGSTARPAKNRVLSDEQEAEVAHWIDRWMDHGFSFENKKKQVSAFAREYMHLINHPNKGVGVGDGFSDGLLGRHPDTKNRVEEVAKAWKVTKSKQEGREAKEARLSRFPAFLRDLQRRIDVPSEHLYVFGDTGFITAILSEHQGLSVEASSREDEVYRQMTSAIICGSHANRILSPYLIAKTDSVNRQRLMHQDISTSFTSQPWANADFFKDWIKCVFEKETIPPRNRQNPPARLLMVDGFRYGITPDIFMNCWNRRIFLVCIPHKGSAIFNPLECGVFSKLHKVYAEEAATKYRERNRPVTIDAKEMTDFFVRHMNRNLLKGQLGKAWTKSHLYTRDEEALRLHVKGIPATPAPPSPAKINTRATRQPQVVQEPMSPPRSAQQPEETRYTHRNRATAARNPGHGQETPERQRAVDSRHSFQTREGTRRDSDNPVPHQRSSPPHADRFSRPSRPSVIARDDTEDNEFDDEDIDRATKRRVSPYDDDSYGTPSICEEAAQVVRGSPQLCQRPDSASNAYMSGARQTPDRAHHSFRSSAPSVEVLDARTFSRADPGNSGPGANQTSISDNDWTGPGLEQAYRMQVRALSNPSTPDAQRLQYEQKLLALAPILSGFAPGAVNALQALAKACSPRLHRQSSSPGPLTPQAYRHANVRKRDSDRRHRYPPRSPRGRNNHQTFTP